MHARLGLDVPNRRLLDALLAFWCVLWLAVGLLVGLQLWQLSGLSRAAEQSASALEEAGSALQSLRQVPIVGDDTASVGDEVVQTAAEVRQSAAEARADVRQLSVLLGVTTALVPTVPLLAVYTWARVRARRDVRDVRAALEAADGPAGEQAVDAYLARRALLHVPYETLTRYTDSPLRDAEQGRHDGLAAAELARLGLQRVDEKQPAASSAQG